MTSSTHKTKSRARRRALTLIEVLVVLALIALIVGAAMIGSGQLSGSKLRHSSTMITGAVRIGFSRASSTTKSIRLVMDFAENEIWLEEGDQPMLVQSKDMTGTGGAAAATVAEKTAIDEGARIVKGPTAARTAFHEIEATGLVASSPGAGHKKLEAGIKFLQVQAQHDEEPRKEGRAYLYFWPGGQTERAVIQLRIDGDPNEKDALTLVVSPLTGKVTIKEGAVSLEKPLTDKEASERLDPGAF